MTRARCGAVVAVLMMLAGLPVAVQTPARARGMAVSRLTPAQRDAFDPASAADRELYLPYARRDFQWLERVAERTMAMGESLGGWDWAPGIAMVGLMHAYEASAEVKYLDYVADWTDERIAEGATFFNPKGMRAPDCSTGDWPAEGVWHPNHAVPAWAVLMLYEHQPKPEYRGVVEGAIRYLTHDACRVDGALAHAPDQLWVDTLMTSAPLLARAAVVLGRPELLDLAAREVLLHAGRLQDPATGLWYHGWHAGRDDHMSGAFWARGNGWAALATAELLTWLPADHAARELVTESLSRQLDGLTRLQHETGRWHTVVDRRDFYLETSGSAAIAAAMLRAASISADPALSEGGWRARRAVAMRVARDGTVTGVSAGTGVADTIDIYNTVPADAIQAHGQGLYLVMAAAAESPRADDGPGGP